MIMSACMAMLTHLLHLISCTEQFEEIHAFSNFSNWLIPGALMLGRYPYVEPVHCLTRTQVGTNMHVQTSVPYA